MNSIFFSPSDWQSITFRLGVALLVGCAIGINRQQPGRPAGLRTFLKLSGLKTLRFLNSPESELQRRFQFASTDST